jgi:hypothetical protein
MIGGMTMALHIERQCHGQRDPEPGSRRSDETPTTNRAEHSAPKGCEASKKRRGEGDATRLFPTIPSGALAS